MSIMQRTSLPFCALGHFSGVGDPKESSDFRHYELARGVDHLDVCLHDDESAHGGEKCDDDEVHLHGDGDGRDLLHGDDGDDGGDGHDLFLGGDGGGGDGRDRGGRDGGHGGCHGDGWRTSLRGIPSGEACNWAASVLDTLDSDAHACSFHPAISPPIDLPGPSLYLNPSPTPRSYGQSSWSSLAADVFCRRCGSRYPHYVSVHTQ